MNRPWMKFYPGDWLGDEALSRSSLAAQGLWMLLLATMHQNTDLYGHMPDTPDGEAVEVARLAGCSADEAAALIADLERRKVLSRSEDGRIYSRRMVRDEAVGRSRANAGRSGGFATAKTQQTLRQTPQQSVASGSLVSGSSSEEGIQGEIGKHSKRQRKEATGPAADCSRWWEAEWERTRLGVDWSWSTKERVGVANCLKHSKGDAQEVQRRMTRNLEHSDRWMAENAAPSLVASRWNQLAIEIVPGPRKSKGDQAMDDFERIRDADRASRAAGQETKQLFGGLA